MLYKFKSDAGADVIMLAGHGRQVLEWMGKPPDPKGIVLPEQMEAALAAIEAALLAHDRQLEKQPDKHAADQACADGDAPPAQEAVSLRARTWPLVALLKQSLKAKVPLVWGV